MKLLNCFIKIIFIFLFVSTIGCSFNNNLVNSYNEFAIKAAKANLWNEAALRWQRIIEIDPNNAKAHNNLGVAYEALEKFDEALRQYELAVELAPQNEAYRRNLNRYKRRHRSTKNEN